ncbi:hypothetical protein SDC9_98390 [bioreactor metagenome]|uniref:Uncharacterized protein n=1 Tax=bioreactor metagenome TaxID=1076179 RepID=A0A645AEM9_9ZZZZ
MPLNTVEELVADIRASPAGSILCPYDTTQTHRPATIPGFFVVLPVLPCPM